MVDKTALRYFMSASSIDIITNKEAASCNINIGEEFTDCSIGNDNIVTVTVTPEQDDFFISAFETQVTIKSKFSETITVPVKVNFVNLGYYAPIGANSGLSIPFITKNDLQGRLAGIRLLPFILAIALFIGGGYWKK